MIFSANYLLICPFHLQPFAFCYFPFSLSHSPPPEGCLKGGVVLLQFAFSHLLFSFCIPPFPSPGGVPEGRGGITSFCHLHFALCYFHFALYYFPQSLSPFCILPFAIFILPYITSPNPYPPFAIVRILPAFELISHIFELIFHVFELNSHIFELIFHVFELIFHVFELILPTLELILPAFRLILPAFYTLLLLL